MGPRSSLGLLLFALGVAAALLVRSDIKHRVGRVGVAAALLVRSDIKHRVVKPAPASLRPTSSTRLSMAITGPLRYASADWLSCMRSLPSSRILARTRSPILAFTGWAALLWLMTKLFRINWLLPAAVSTVMGPTISLLLVFRTNSSYERFLEARKAQSSMLQACRNIASHASVHVPAEDWPELARLLVGYAILQKQHLQGRVDSSELAAVFSHELLAEVEARNNRPLAVIQKIERLLHKSLTNKYRQSAATGDSFAPKYIEKHFIECLNALQAQLASCERIVKQPVPLSYSRHLSRYLSFYLLLLPMSLIQPLGLGAVPMTALIAWSLVSILEIGHWIEQPMGACPKQCGRRHIIA